MQRRPFVEWIADELEMCLQRNDTKPAWEDQSHDELNAKINEELGEFLDEVGLEDAKGVNSEGIDLIAVVAMMMAKYNDNLPEWKRGRLADVS